MRFDFTHNSLSYTNKRCKLFLSYPFLNSFLTK